MKYLCLIYENEQHWANATKDKIDTLMGEYFAFSDDIRKSGHYLGGNGLQPVSTATTIRVRNGKVSTTDGPFAETKEQLGGYFLIDVPDMQEALRIAEHWPSARLGVIEVRPIEDELRAATRY